jgi:hypothetical protein
MGSIFLWFGPASAAVRIFVSILSSGYYFFENLSFVGNQEIASNQVVFNQMALSRIGASGVTWTLNRYLTEVIAALLGINRDL